MALIKCPECGHVVSDRAKTCPNCGVEIAGKIITCPDCGEVIFKDMAECNICHCTINAAESTYEPVAEAPTETKGGQPATHSEPKPAKTPPKKVKYTYSAVVVSLVIALIIVLLGLYFYQTSQQHSELRAYENAVSSDEPAVLQNFLDIYTDAPQAHRDSVMAHLDELKKIDLEWASVLASKNKGELERYVARHPGNIHVTEAKVLIDSLDWAAALADNTADAYQLYLDAHPDGYHIDEARDLFERTEALRLKDEERDMLRVLFNDYFMALAQRNETVLVATLAPELSSFMAKEHALPSDVVAYMQSLYASGDIITMVFTMADDWKINKQPIGTEGQFSYGVTFTVDQRIDRSNQELERFATYRVKAQVTPSHRIAALNMQKIVQ